jgi:hypothetical protein
MKAKNMMRILNEMLVKDLSIIRKELKIVFDQDYSRRMYDHPKYMKLQKTMDEHYRDLNLVWSDPFCLHQKLDRTNTLHIDCCTRKV